MVEQFGWMNLREALLPGIYDYGFERPSAIQQRASIPCILSRDVIAQAQSGTGKTATFAISILQQLDSDLKGLSDTYSGTDARIGPTNTESDVGSR